MPLQIRTCSLGKQRSENIWYCRINVTVEKPRSYWGEGNTVYRVKCYIYSGIYTLLLLRKRGQNAWGLIYLSGVFCCSLVWILLRAKLLMSGHSPSLSLSTNPCVSVALSAASPIPWHGFPRRSTSLWSNMDPPKHTPHAAPLPGFLPGDCPTLAPNPF